MWKAVYVYLIFIDLYLLATQQNSKNDYKRRQVKYKLKSEERGKIYTQ